MSYIVVIGQLGPLNMENNMVYEIEVCDFGSLENDEFARYGVSINDSVKYFNDDVDECKKVARLLRDSYNRGLSKMLEMAQLNISKCELKNSLFFEPKVITK